MKISRKLVQLLKQMRVTSAKFENDKIIVSLEHVPLPISEVKIVEHEPEVGSWFKEREKNIIRIDNDIQRKRWILSLAVHEVLERWIKDTFFPTFPISEVYPYPIHTIAEHIEEKWHKSKFGSKSWKDYSKRIEEVWEKENR